MVGVFPSMLFMHHLVYACIPYDRRGLLMSFLCADLFAERCTSQSPKHASSSLIPFHIKASTRYEQLERDFFSQNLQAFSIFINGVFHCSVRYSQLCDFNDKVRFKSIWNVLIFSQLKQDFPEFMEKIPFPPKRVLSLSMDQVIFFSLYMFTRWGWRASKGFGKIHSIGEYLWNASGYLTWPRSARFRRSQKALSLYRSSTMHKRYFFQWMHWLRS